MLAQMDAVTKAVDHAAQQDMRWWFLGLLALVILAVAWLARYFMRRLDKVQDERTKYLEEQGSEMAAALRENAGALRNFSEAVSSVKHLFEPHQIGRSTRH